MKVLWTSLGTGATYPQAPLPIERQIDDTYKVQISQFREYFTSILFVNYDSVWLPGLIKNYNNLSSAKRGVSKLIKAYLAKPAINGCTLSFCCNCHDQQICKFYAPVDDTFVYCKHGQQLGWKWFCSSKEAQLDFLNSNYSKKQNMVKKEDLLKRNLNLENKVFEAGLFER